MCRCHGAPMTKNGHSGSSGKPQWTCTVGSRERARENYENLPGHAAIRKALQQRRAAALKRMSERGASGEVSS